MKVPAMIVLELSRRGATAAAEVADGRTTIREDAAGDLSKPRILALALPRLHRAAAWDLPNNRATGMTGGHGKSVLRIGRFS